MNFQCTRCSRTGRYSSWVTARWRNWNVPHRCEHCGTVHSVAYGRPPDPISPPLLDIYAGGVLSPWFAAKYRPYRDGTYECEFAGDLRLVLQWQDRAWRHRGLVVDIKTLIKWRGGW